MNCNYLIKVKSVNVVDGEKTETEVITHADFSGDKDNYVIVYTEDKDGTAETTRLEVIAGNKVKIFRDAEMKTEMTVEEGIRHISYHTLPFGEFSLDVVGRSVTSLVSPDGVILSFSYMTYSGGEALGAAEFNITVRRKGKIPGDFLREE